MISPDHIAHQTVKLFGYIRSYESLGAQNVTVLFINKAIEIKMTVNDYVRKIGIHFLIFICIEMQIIREDTLIGDDESKSLAAHVRTSQTTKIRKIVCRK